MRDDRERLLDMLEAIQKIEQYADDEWTRALQWAGRCALQPGKPTQ